MATRPARFEKQDKPEISLNQQEIDDEALKIEGERYYSTDASMFNFNAKSAGDFINKSETAKNFFRKYQKWRRDNWKTDAALSMGLYFIPGIGVGLGAAKSALDAGSQMSNYGTVNAFDALGAAGGVARAAKVGIQATKGIKAVDTAGDVISVTDKISKNFQRFKNFAKSDAKLSKVFNKITGLKHVPKNTWDDAGIWLSKYQSANPATKADMISKVLLKAETGATTTLFSLGEMGYMMDGMVRRNPARIQELNSKLQNGTITPEEQTELEKLVEGYSDEKELAIKRLTDKKSKFLAKYSDKPPINTSSDEQARRNKYGFNTNSNDEPNDSLGNDAIRRIYNEANAAYGRE